MVELLLVELKDDDTLSRKQKFDKLIKYLHENPDEITFVIEEDLSFLYQNATPELLYMMKTMLESMECVMTHGRYHDDDDIDIRPGDAFIEFHIPRYFGAIPEVSFCLN